MSLNREEEKTYFRPKLASVAGEQVACLACDGEQAVGFDDAGDGDGGGGDGSWRGWNDGDRQRVQRREWNGDADETKKKKRTRKLTDVDYGSSFEEFEAEFALFQWQM